MFVNTGYHAGAREKENIKKKRAQKKGKETQTEDRNTRRRVFVNRGCHSDGQRKRGGKKNMKRPVFVNRGYDVNRGCHFEAREKGKIQKKKEGRKK